MNAAELKAARVALGEILAEAGITNNSFNVGMDAQLALAAALHRRIVRASRSPK